MKEFTAVLTKDILRGFCTQTSKERRNDIAANTWFSFVGLYFVNCLPPSSFNLATSYISWGILYALQRGLPNNAMYFGVAKSDNGFPRFFLLCLWSSPCLFPLFSTSHWRATKGSNTLTSGPGPNAP